MPLRLLVGDWYFIGKSSPTCTALMTDHLHFVVLCGILRISPLRFHLTFRH